MAHKSPNPPDKEQRISHSPENQPMTPGSTEDSALMPRREFISWTGRSLLAATGVAALGGSILFALPKLEGGASKRFSIGSTADFKMRTLTWLREFDLFVVRDAAGFGAFSSRCTHLGCGVQRMSEGFVCPCHGARYDAMGNVTSGPARRALPWYHVWQEADGRLWVDTATEVERGTKPLMGLPDGNLSGAAS